MAENKIKEVAELLGIEMDKPFNIKGYEFNPCVLTENRFINNCGQPLMHVIHDTLFMLLTGKLEIEKPILSDSEKNYLENVLKPFKDRVVYVEKIKPGDPNYEYIGFKIIYEDNRCPNNWCYLPYFDKGTMYKGMELDEQYSLEELGLFRGDDE